MSSWFSPALFQFLTDLEANNNREWFEANKARYERDVKEPALRFIAAFAEPLASISPHFRAIPKAVGGSMFRLHRDTRFSADKRPYKNNIGLHFRHEAGPDAHTPGYYLHLQPGECFVGLGLWMPDPPTLARIRAQILAEPAIWGAMKASLAAASLPIGPDEQALKKPPRDAPMDHPHRDDLRWKSFTIGRPMTEAEVCAPDLMERYTEICQDGSPLVSFLCEAVGQPF